MTNILLTRPQDKSEAFAEKIAECGWTATIWPLLTIQRLRAEPIEPSTDQAIIFTSARAVETLPDPAPINTPAVCVGPATAAAATRRGFSSVQNMAGDADRLVDSLKTADPKAYIHVRGVHSRGDVAARLTAAGRPTTEVVVYEAVAADAAPREIDTAILTGKIDAIALFSPRSASIFRRLARREWSERLSMATVYAISAAAAKPISDMGFAEVALAKRPDGQGMRAVICSAGNE